MKPSQLVSARIAFNYDSSSMLKSLCLCRLNYRYWYRYTGTVSRLNPDTPLEAQHIIKYVLSVSKVGQRPIPESVYSAFKRDHFVQYCRPSQSRHIPCNRRRSNGSTSERIANPNSISLFLLSSFSAADFRDFGVDHR